MANDGSGLPNVEPGEAEAALKRATTIFEQLAITDIPINRSDLNGAPAEGNAAITLKPFRSLCHGMYGQLMVKAGRHDDAVACYLTAFKLDPRDGNNVESVKNIFDDLPQQLPKEVVQTLIQAVEVRIERIISHGHASASDF